METGEQVGSMLTGTATTIDISPHLRLMRPDQRYLLLHTHPRSTSLSNVDVLTLASQLSIRVLIVMEVDGSWFVASFQSEIRAMDPRLVFDAYQNVYRELESEGVAHLERPHETMRRIAATFEVRYDRVSGN